MLKNKKQEKGVLNETYVGSYYFEGYDGLISSPIAIDGVNNGLEDNEYYYTEFHSDTSESDYHTFCETYHFKGVHMVFRLNKLDSKKYFGVDLSDALYCDDVLIEAIRLHLKKKYLLGRWDDIHIDPDGDLSVTLLNRHLDSEAINIGNIILQVIRNYYDSLGIHVTRMFGSYVLLRKENKELKAIYATSVPIKYCPLMIKLLKEVGGDAANKLIESLNNEDETEQILAMCNLINEVVIKGGYFDTNRPLNSCEANVTFGASETMSSAFKTDLIDASVIVSNNLGTIITTNDFNTQGSVKRMTGLFHTSPNETLVNTAYKEGIIPVFPHTGIIDQLEGVKKAISLGYKRIAVSVACFDNYLHEELSNLEKENNVKIYKFGLCSTGIDLDTAIKMRDYADVIWSCASKYVKEEIEPNAILQVGIKIPVYVMTKQGYEIVRNHLNLMNGLNDEESIELNKEDRPVLLNSSEGIKVLKKSALHTCHDCPHPCV